MHYSIIFTAQNGTKDEETGKMRKTDYQITKKQAKALTQYLDAR